MPLIDTAPGIRSVWSCRNVSGSRGLESPNTITRLIISITTRPFTQPQSSGFVTVLPSALRKFLFFWISNKSWQDFRMLGQNLEVAHMVPGPLSSISWRCVSLFVMFDFSNSLDNPSNQFWCFRLLPNGLVAIFKLPHKFIRKNFLPSFVREIFRKVREMLGFEWQVRILQAENSF